MAAEWVASIRVARPDPAGAERLARALAPEAAREVARGRSTVRRDGTNDVVIDLSARDTGALRAAVNTYLGWIRLALATESVAEARSAGEALI